jgi:hypothetical protein
MHASAQYIQYAISSASSHREITGANYNYLVLTTLLTRSYTCHVDNILTPANSTLCRIMTPSHSVVGISAQELQKLQGSVMLCMLVCSKQLYWTHLKIYSFTYLD